MALRRAIAIAGVLVLRGVGAFAPARLLTGASCLPALRAAAASSVSTRRGHVMLGVQRGDVVYMLRVWTVPECSVHVYQLLAAT